MVEEDDIKILKKRYAKGEITRKQYLEIKKELNEEMINVEPRQKEVEKSEFSSQYQKQNKRSHLGRNIIILLIVIIVAYLAYQPFAQAAAFKNVQISLADISLGSIGLTGAQLNLELSMYNPGSTTATLSSISYSVYGNNNYLGSGSINQQVSIPPGGTDTVQTTFSISYIGAAQTILSAIKTNSVSWELKGTASFNTIVGPSTIPFDFIK